MHLSFNPAFNFKEFVLKIHWQKNINGHLYKVSYNSITYISKRLEITKMPINRELIKVHATMELSPGRWCPFQVTLFPRSHKEIKKVSMYQYRMTYRIYSELEKKIKGTE